MRNVCVGGGVGVMICLKTEAQCDEMVINMH